MLHNFITFLQNFLLAAIDFAVMGSLVLFTLFAFCISSLGFVFATLLARGKDDNIIDVTAERVWFEEK
ncbi:hypothetical protein ACLSZ5_05310 [Avibacterium avium]|uniref:Uncharacterized protein n=2 Tax=Avibacterium TaxID=292486 RepID=A0A379ATI7_AVIAV|nr:MULTISPECIES: hypothetical protein [Avibacterium]POY43011.1 hypothetical protein C3Z13_01535 [Avibacterium endocarditidis]SUB25018.1 Uncharacterised protein [Avibacterium avium]